MKRIRNYEDFTNEEINLKRALATSALAAGMALSNQAKSQTVEKPKIELSQKIYESTVINSIIRDNIHIYISKSIYVYIIIYNFIKVY